MQQKVTRPVLRYFGGKWLLAPWVISHLPAHRIYVEPFGGAASVLMRKDRSQIEVYNDMDGEIVGLFRVLQDQAQCRRLMRMLKFTPYSRAEFAKAFDPTSDPLERSRRAIVRAYQAFHHSSLFNPRKTTFADAKHKAGGSCAAHGWSRYWRTLAAVHSRLQGVVIDQQPASRVIAAQDCRDAVFFVDPPYLPATRGDGGYRCEMTADEHVALLTQLRGISGRTVVAGYPSELYDDMLQGWARHTRSANAAGSLRKRTEVLWVSPG